eukprot:a339470_2770.p2 GENE.a339470_2770~~a339470_2770.p2  ORF type:complete len:233 (-),score=104.14 a339470_2770:40-705(-)
MFAAAARRLVAPAARVAARAASTSAAPAGKASVAGGFVAGVAVAFGAMSIDWSTAAADGAATPIVGVPGTNKERTFLMVKPDAVERGHIADIIGRWEKRGYKLVGLKMIEPSRELVSAHYADLKERPFYGELVDYMSSSGPVVAMCWEGKDVIRTSRVMIGKTNPLESPPGTVRADLSVDVQRNSIHGSDGVDGATSEIPLWFTASEITNFERAIDKKTYA